MLMVNDHYQMDIPRKDVKKIREWFRPRARRSIADGMAERSMRSSPPLRASSMVDPPADSRG